MSRYQNIGLSRNVHLAYLLTIPFTLDTISSQDANFSISDLGAFSINSNPESNFFFHLRTASWDTLVDP